MATGVCELFDFDTLPGSWKRVAEDWKVAFNMANPSVQRTKMKVDFEFQVDHESSVQIKFSVLCLVSNFQMMVDFWLQGVIILLNVLEAKSDKDNYVRSICFSPDGKYIAAGTEDRIIRIWDIAQRTVKFELMGHNEDIYGIDWSRDGRTLVSGSGDATVKVWDVEKGSLLISIQNNQDMQNTTDLTSTQGVTSVAIRSLDSRIVATGSLDRMVRLWDIRTGRLLERFEAHTDNVYSVAFSPDGQSIVSGSLDKNVIVWDISPHTHNYLAKSGESVVEDLRPVVSTTYRQCFTGHRDFVLSVAFAGTNSTLGRVDACGEPVAAQQSDVLAEVEWVVSASKDKTVVFWDARAVPEFKAHSFPNQEAIAKNAAIFALQGHKNSVISVALASVAGLFATGSGDFSARVWRVSAEGPLVPAGPSRPQIQQQMSVKRNMDEMNAPVPREWKTQQDMYAQQQQQQQLPAPVLEPWQKGAQNVSTLQQQPPLETWRGAGIPLSSTQQRLASGVPEWQETHKSEWVQQQGAPVATLVDEPLLKKEEEEIVIQQPTPPPPPEPSREVEDEQNGEKMDAIM
ncbi:general transcription repressor [Nowakowskiella sp. JEL0078]|nr:general transcription repressor [Nowakowskiella sp. JEL0078]